MNTNSVIRFALTTVISCSVFAGCAMDASDSEENIEMDSEALTGNDSGTLVAVSRPSDALSYRTFDDESNRYANSGTANLLASVSVTTNITFVADGKNGSAIRFDNASSTRVGFTHPRPNTNAYTQTYWFKYENVAQDAVASTSNSGIWYGPLASVGGFGVLGLRTNFPGTSSQLFFMAMTGNQYTLVANPSVAPGEWHHAAIMHKGATTVKMDLYLDGVKVVSDFQTQRAPRDYEPTVSYGMRYSEYEPNVHIGATALMDTAKYFNRAISASEVHAEYFCSNNNYACGVYADGGDSITCGSCAGGQVCTTNGQCVVGNCVSDADCNDNNPSTTDSCVNNMCENVATNLLQNGSFESLSGGMPANWQVTDFMAYHTFPATTTSSDASSGSVSMKIEHTYSCMHDPACGHWFNGDWTTISQDVSGAGLVAGASYRLTFSCKTNSNDAFGFSFADSTTLMHATPAVSVPSTDIVNDSQWHTASYVFTMTQSMVDNIASGYEPRLALYWDYNTLGTIQLDNVILAAQ